MRISALRSALPTTSRVLLLLAVLAFPLQAQDLNQVVNDPEMLWGSEVPEGWTGDWPEELRTISERSGFTRTMGVNDMHEFLDAVKWRSEYVHVFDIFETPMGNVSSAIVLANPRVTSP